MNQVAFKMKLIPGFETEYKKRHDEIWPELSKELADSGVYDYAIYLDAETNILFAVQKLTESNTSADLAKKEVVRKWWNHMSDIMEVNEDNSPVVSNLTEVFYQI
jgi:L-rhamnose mutarotase